MGDRKKPGRIAESIKRQLDKLPYIRSLRRQVDMLAVPPDHFYSPLVTLHDVERRRDDIWQDTENFLPGIDLQEQEQLLLLDEFRQIYKKLPFPAQPADELRYYYENPMFSWSDGIFLFCMIHHFKPERIIEIGSGFSSALVMDTNQLSFNNMIRCTFIDPNPERLHSLLRDDDEVTIHKHPVQEIDPALFGQLKENDFLFIDSTHVSKTGSDVNYLLFDIIPGLGKGVKIHFHDIFWPFEYPQTWVIERKRSWNESYLLRAFLTCNEAYRIVLFNTYLEQFHESWFWENMPDCLKNRGGSLWIEKK